MIPVVDTLCQLVKIPSVNPMGRALAGPQYYEYAMTDHLERLFGELGWPCERQPVAPLRENILARVEGDVPPEKGGPLVMWDVHQDTVPVDGMTIPPWEPAVRDGRVWGRGSCDIKGGMAAMITALSRLAKEPRRGRPTIVLACTINEEHGYTGATAIAQLWATGHSRILPRTPDAIIVAEPTSLDVVVAHKGVSRWRCHAHGRAVHSSRPQLGENAIYAMSKVLGALERYAVEVAPKRGTHRLVGTPTLSVGTISGGISVNTVPDECVIEIDRRVLPGEDALMARQEVIDFLQQQLPGTIRLTHEPHFICSGGLSEQRNGELAAQMTVAIRACGGKGEHIGVPYGTDASAYSPLGVPSVVFGPGSIEQAHTSDEWIEISQLEACVEMLCAFARG
jgi:acetylornithine deacetylase